MKRFKGEEGFAMITALGVSVIVLFMSVTVVTLSVHNSTSSAFDRDRLQAVDAAEAGIDNYLSSLTGAVGSATCTTQTGTPASRSLPKSSCDAGASSRRAS